MIVSIMDLVYAAFAVAALWAWLRMRLDAETQNRYANGCNRRIALLNKAIDIIAEDRGRVLLRDFDLPEHSAPLLHFAMTAQRRRLWNGWPRMVVIK